MIDTKWLIKEAQQRQQAKHAAEHEEQQRRRAELIQARIRTQQEFVAKELPSIADRIVYDYGQFPGSGGYDLAYAQLFVDNVPVIICRQTDGIGRHTIVLCVNVFHPKGIDESFLRRKSLHEEEYRKDADLEDVVLAWIGDTLSDLEEWASMEGVVLYGSHEC
jgi:hypothetical protein